MSPSRFIVWAVWLVASIFYAYQYILRVMPNIMFNDIMNQFQIDTTIFGQLSGVYYITYSLMHLPMGIMLDRFGPKKVMPICTLLTVIGLTPIIFAENWIYPLLGRALIGMGSSAAILGLFKIIRMTFTEKHFTRMLSFSVTIGLIGAIYGGTPISYMCDVLGYKMVVTIMAFIGVALAIVTYLIVPEMAKTPKTAILSDVKEVLSEPRVIYLCLFAGFMVGPLEGFADVWGTEFLKNVYFFDNVVSSSLPSMIFIGMCFGGPILSLIAEKTGHYLATVIGAGLLMAVCFFILISGQMTPTIIGFSFILVGICCAYQIIAIYKASTYVREGVVGLTTAVANMIIMSFGYVFHTFIGLIINLMENEGPSKSFVYGVGIIPVMLSIGVVGFVLLALKERMRLKKA
ncbi:MAG: MFS transporter [Alphaproteobacteria bacterium]|nr:MFS transporter [Alphaproteobacteria bacterium]